MRFTNDGAGAQAAVLGWLQRVAFDHVPEPGHRDFDTALIRAQQLAVVIEPGAIHGWCRSFGDGEFHRRVIVNQPSSAVRTLEHSFFMPGAVTMFVGL